MTTGATAVTGTRAVLVATKCSSCGTVQVRIGTYLFATVSLRSSTTVNRAVIQLPRFTRRTGVLRLTVSGAGYVRVDGLGISRK